MAFGKERRQSRRVTTEIELLVSGLDDAEVGARARNLSAGGAYLEVTKPLAPLSKLAIEMELPPFAGADRQSEATRIATEAIVVRVDPEPVEGYYKVGVAFLNMRPDERQRLEDYIEWRLTRSILESVESGLASS